MRYNLNICATVSEKVETNTDVREEKTMKELLLKNRTYRKFDQEKPVTKEQMDELLEALRFVPQGGNMQKMKFITSVSKEMNDQIFQTLKFAALLKDWGGPTEDERPTAYIVLVKDKGTNIMMQDAGILELAAGLLGAEQGIGCCILASVNRPVLSQILGIEEEYDIVDVIAMGYPKQTVEIVESNDGTTEYYVTEDGTHCVKKLPIAKRVVKQF